jgi:hypothetical protein
VRSDKCLAARKGHGAYSVCMISDCKAINLDEICIGITASIQQLANKEKPNCFNILLHNINDSMSMTAENVNLTLPLRRPAR